jgi:hypothetical protein
LKNDFTTLVDFFFFFRAAINHFYVVHENAGLYACSKGRPTKALAKKRLECPDEIKEELAGLSKVFCRQTNVKCLFLCQWLLMK